MIYRFLTLSILLCSMYGFTAIAQTDTSYDLPVALVEVRSEKPYHGIDSLSTLSDISSLSSLLQKQPFVQVRANSGMALASFSIRGGSPEQSSVFWNGISLQNNTNGVVDLNLLPTSFFDKVEFNSLQSTNRGSGSTAGSMNLRNNKIHGDSAKEITWTAGSFQTASMSASLGYRTKHLWHQTRVLASKSENNYPYRSIRYAIDRSIDTLSHSASAMFGALHQTTITFSKLRPLHFRIWLQKNEREIPATKLESASRKSQTDEVARVQGDWSFRVNKGDLRVNAAWFNERLVYRDFDTFNYSSNNGTVLLHYVKPLTEKHKIGLDAESRVFTADGDTFYNKQRRELSTAVHFQYVNERLSINSSVRLAGYSSFQTSPLLYHLSASLPMASSWQLHTKFNSNYRIPTFNSLYWRPGGNENLIPESSHQQELRIQYQQRKLSLKIAAYSTLLTNQIQWLPSSKGYFEAVQQPDKRHWNRGVELEASYIRRKYKSSLQAAYLRSGEWTIGEDVDTKQARFTPMINLNHSIAYTPSRWMLEISNQFVSARYTDVDNTEQLDAYLLLNTSVGYRFAYLDLQILGRNILNTSYEILPYRPMPGQYFELSLRWRIQDYLNNTKPKK